MKDIITRINESNNYNGENKISIKQNGRKVDLLNMDMVAVDLLMELLDAYLDEKIRLEEPDDAWPEAAEELFKALEHVED